MMEFVVFFGCASKWTQMAFYIQFLKTEDNSLKDYIPPEILTNTITTDIKELYQQRKDPPAFLSTFTSVVQLYSD